MIEPSGIFHPQDTEFFLPTKLHRELLVLISVHGDPDISQYRLASAAGMCPTQANTYIRALTGKGLIIKEGKNNRNMTYRLSETGQQRLNGLLSSYSLDIVHIYSAFKNELRKQLKFMTDSGYRRVVLFGAGETAQLVYAALETLPINVISIVDNDISKQGQRFFGILVEPPTVIDKIQPDCILITSYAKQDEIFEQIMHLTDVGIHVQKLFDLWGTTEEQYFR